MNLNLVLVDEKGNGGKQVSLHQGEIKTISCYFINPVTGAPYAYTALTEVVVAISEGTSASLKKKLSLTQVTLLSGLTGTVGFSFSLSATDSAALPVSSTVGMSVQLIDSTTIQDEVDVPNAFNVSAPLVS